MAGLKEIRRRLKSVNNTKKITYAMKLVSAAKLRKTQDAVTRSRAYTDALRQVLADVLAGETEVSHPLMVQRDKVKTIRLVVLGGARGLCGAYNSGINRKTEAFIKEQQKLHPQAVITATLFGKKPAEFFRRINQPFSESFEVLPDDPGLWPTDDVSRQLEVDFLKSEVDEVYILYTKFKSAISMTPTIEKILPVDPAALLQGGKSKSASSNALFEPSKEAVFGALVPRLVRSMMRQAALDTKASEHASRMTAMDAATKNASEIIQSLTLLRNRLRQSSITSQLLDIVGGAEALN